MTSLILYLYGQLSVSPQRTPRKYLTDRPKLPKRLKLGFFLTTAPQVNMNMLTLWPAKTCANVSGNMVSKVFEQISLCQEWRNGWTYLVHKANEFRAHEEIPSVIVRMSCKKYSFWVLSGQYKFNQQWGSGITNTYCTISATRSSIFFKCSSSSFSSVTL